MRFDRETVELPIVRRISREKQAFTATKGAFQTMRREDEELRITKRSVYV